MALFTTLRGFTFHPSPCRSSTRAVLSAQCLRPHSPAPAALESLGGPGTGQRHYPEDLGQQFDQAAPKPDSFQCKTTQQCYEEFPFLVHTSVPLGIQDREPAGVTVEHTPDAGPATGHRRRPSAVDSEALQHPPRLPDPAAPKDLKKELTLRHHPEEVLQQH